MPPITTALIIANVAIFLLQSTVPGLEAAFALWPLNASRMSGGQVGFAIGYKYIFLAFELTLAGVSGRGDVKTAPDPRNGEALAHNADISGFIIYPAFGLMGEF